MSPDTDSFKISRYDEWVCCLWVLNLKVLFRNDASYNANTGPSCANDAVKVNRAIFSTRLCTQGCQQVNWKKILFYSISRSQWEATMEQVAAPLQTQPQPPQWTGQTLAKIHWWWIFEIFDQSSLIYELNIIEAKCLTLVRYCGGALNCDGANPAKTQSHTIVRSRKLLKEFIINKLFTYFQWKASFWAGGFLQQPGSGFYK